MYYFLLQIANNNANCLFIAILAQIANTPPDFYPYLLRRIMVYHMLQNWDLLSVSSIYSFLFFLTVCQLYAPKSLYSFCLLQPLVGDYLGQQKRSPIQWARHQLDENSRVGHEGLIVLNDYMKVSYKLGHFQAKKSYG